jgi:hypothetical protein
VLDYVRRNAIGFLALFVALGGTGAYAANTITGNDVVDGSLTSADIKDANLQGLDLRDGTIGSAKVTDNGIASRDVLDNSLTAADIDESTLKIGPIGNAQTLGGLPREAFRQYTRTAVVNTSDCAAVNAWTGCAPVTVSVPANHTYVVTVRSSVNAFSQGTQTAGMCAASDGPTCLDAQSSPDLVTLWGGAYTMGVSSRTLFVGGPQTFTAQTAIKLATALNASPNAKTITEVEVYDAAVDGS